MVSIIDLTIERIRADQDAKARLNPPLDTAKIFEEAQAKAALERAATPPRLTPEAASTPAVVVVAHVVQPRTDLRRLIQPVTVRGH